MKRIIPILSTLLALLICSACTNADEPDTQKADTETKDNYYVRYEISNGSAFSVRGNVATEKGNLDFSENSTKHLVQFQKGSEHMHMHVFIMKAVEEVQIIIFAYM